MAAVNRQQGVALITSLLVVALVTILAGTMVGRLHLDLRRIENQRDIEQAFRYHQGLETLAVIALAEDAKQSAGNDHRGERWAQPLPLLPVERGVITGRLVDLDGRFNLNNLLINQVEQGGQIAIFRRLLRLQGFDSNLVDAVLDWLDDDALPRTHGAEDNRYLRQRPAYRTANQAFSHLSELGLVAGFDAEMVASLAPFLCVVPTSGAPTPINVNSALPLLLQALDPAINEATAQVLYQEGRARWRSIADFRGHPLVLGRVPALSAELIGVDSRFFAVNSSIELDGRLQHYHSLLMQDGNRVLQRSRSPF